MRKMKTSKNNSVASLLVTFLPTEKKMVCLEFYDLIPSIATLKKGLTNTWTSCIQPAPNQLHLEILQPFAYISWLQVRKKLLATWEDVLLWKLFRSNSRKHSPVCNFHVWHFTGPGQKGAQSSQPARSSKENFTYKALVDSATAAACSYLICLTLRTSFSCSMNLNTEHGAAC